MTIKLKLKRPHNEKSVIWTEFKKNGTHYKFYSGKTIETENWSVKKGTVLSGNENYELINEYLEEWASEIKKIFAEMERNKERPIQEVIQKRLDQKFKKDKPEAVKTAYSDKIAITDFTSFMEHFIELKRNDGKFLQKLEQAQKSVLIAFNLISKKKLQEYDRLSNRQKSKVLLKADFKLPFEEINLKFLQSLKNI